MPHSDLHRCTFVHIPRNAGTSICLALDLHPGIHRPWAFYREQNPERWADYLSFAVIRNPWERLASCYRYARTARSYHHDASTGNAHPDHALLSTLTFAQALRLLGTPHLQHPGWLPQADWICDATGRVQVNHLLRYESLADDWACLFSGIDLPGHVNASAPDEEPALYGPEEVQAVRDYYARDLAIFGYPSLPG